MRGPNVSKSRQERLVTPGATLPLLRASPGVYGVSSPVDSRPGCTYKWHEHDELKIYHEALEQIEFADKLGYDYVFITEGSALTRDQCLCMIIFV